MYTKISLLHTKYVLHLNKKTLITTLRKTSNGFIKLSDIMSDSHTASRIDFNGKRQEFSGQKPAYIGKFIGWRKVETSHNEELLNYVRPCAPGC